MLALFGLLFLCGSAVGDNPHLRNVLQQQIENYRDLWNVADLARVMNFYTGDATLLVPGMPIIQGNKSILVLLGSMINKTKIVSVQTFDADWLHVPGAGEAGYAYVRGVATSQPTDGSNANIVADFVEVWIVNQKGQWKVYTDATVHQGDSKMVSLPPYHSNAAAMLRASIAPAPIVAPSNRVNSTDDVVKQMIASANKKWMAAFATGNATAVAELYAPDAVAMAENAPSPFSGRDAIAGLFAGAMKQGVATVELRVIDAGVVVSDRFYYERSVYVFHDKNGAVIDVGKYVVIWHMRSQDDKLELYIDCFNSDHTGSAK